MSADKKGGPRDADLFKHAMADVKPIAKRPTLSLAQPVKKPVAAPPPPGTREVTPVKAPPPPRRPAGLDRATEERFRKGEMPIDRRIDLHGMTLEEAHQALDRFISRAWVEGARVLLVITGKGEGGSGTLRQDVPKWLDSGAHAQIILRHAGAQARHGGGGALYVLLRRQRAP